MMCILISYDFFFVVPLTFFCCYLYGKMRKCTFCVKIKTGILHIFFLIGNLVIYNVRLNLTVLFVFFYFNENGID